MINTFLVKETDLKTIEKALRFIKDTHYESVASTNAYIFEDNPLLRVGSMRKKRYVLKAQSKDKRTHIESLILQQTSFSTADDFYKEILIRYENTHEAEANAINALVTISDLLFVFKRTNIFLCKDNKLMQRAKDVFIAKIANEWANEHFLIAFINMFEIFSLLQKVFSEPDVVYKYVIEQGMSLISIFYLKKHYDYKPFISRAIEMKNEVALARIIRVYSEGLDYLLTDKHLPFQLSISVVVEILQLANIKKDSDLIKVLIGNYTKYSSENQCDYHEYSKLIVKLFDDNTQSNNDFIVKTIESVIAKLIELKHFQTAHQIISNFKLRKSLSYNLISGLLAITPFDFVKFMGNLIEIQPSLYENTFHEYLKAKKSKELAKLIQNLKDIPLKPELVKIAKKKSLKRFYKYKYESCKSQLDILLDYTINDPPFFNYILTRYLNQSYLPEALYMMNASLVNSIPLTEKAMNSISAKFGTKDLNDVLTVHSSFNTIVIDDSFGPTLKGALSLGREVNVVFADTPSQVTQFFTDHFMKSSYLGIDSEWKQNYTSFDKPEVSILQICDEDEKNIIIIDMSALKNSTPFIEAFSIIKGKKLIGYSFEVSDIANFSNKDIVRIFSTSSIINLGKPSSNKVSLCALYKQKLSKDICKYEQCSNWNNRPLRKKQLHYAALDALICVQLYKSFQSSITSN